jgi:ATP-dependent Lon protease
VMLPARNQRDMEEIPADTRAAMKFVWLETVDEAVATALRPAGVT